jgi:hypothetical protein
MRLYVPLGELNKHWLSFDKVHDPAIYGLDINDPTLIDTMELGVRRAQKWENDKKTSSKNESALIQEAKKESLPRPRMHRNEREELKARIREKHHEIKQRISETNAMIMPRTQAKNTKSPYASIEEERADRAEVLASQIRAWRSLLPTIIQRFSRIPDPRRPGSVKHSLVMLMIYGLLAFVFRLSSRREINRELTGPLIHEHLQKIFPEIDSIPHADTLARLLEKINPKKIEAAHVALIQELIRKKKFKKLLIHGCLPISIDGTQKLYRDGLLHDDHWCERKVGTANNPGKQQYVYVLEANITLRNGLTIPLLTEYLYQDNNELINPIGKQDCETTAFERLAERLKGYFPRLKMLLFMDALFAIPEVMEINSNNKWEYMISLPTRKLSGLTKQLRKNKNKKTMIPNQSHYRGRQQEFYWTNNISYGYTGNVKIHLVACSEHYDEVNKKTGEIERKFSEYTWISSIPITIDNVHELCNLGARKKQFIEDSINTEKNRGYSAPRKRHSTSS